MRGLCHHVVVTNDANDPQSSNPQPGPARPRTYGEALDDDLRRRRDFTDGNGTQQTEAAHSSQPQQHAWEQPQDQQRGPDAPGSAGAPPQQPYGGQQGPQHQQSGWAPSPDSPYSSQQPSGQPYPGQQYPSQQYPGQQYPSQQHPGQQYPGQQNSGQPYPGQPYQPHPGGSASWNTPDQGPHYGPGGFNGQTPNTGWAPATPAGLFPLRPLSFGDIFGATFRLLRFSPAASFGGAFLLQFLSALIAAIAPMTVLLSNIESPIFDESSAWTSAHTQFLVWFLLSLVPSILVTVATTAAVQTIVAQVTAAGAVGQRVTLGQALRRATKRLLPVAGYLIVTSLISIMLVGVLLALPVIWLISTATADQAPLAPIGVLILSVILLIVVMVFVNTKFMFGVTIVVLEEVGPISALRRSWALTNGLFWRTFGINLLVSMLVSTVTSMAAQAIGLVLALLGQVLFPVGAQSDPNSPELVGFAIVMGLIGALASAIFGAVYTVLMSGNITMLYADARMRKEGLNVALQSAADAVAAGQPVPTDTWQAKPANTTGSAHTSATPPASYNGQTTPHTW